MHLEEVHLEVTVEEKILKKHGVTKEEIEEVLMLDESKHFKTKWGRYASWKDLSA